MAAPAQTSKSAKKKAAKAIERTDSPAPSNPASVPAEKPEDDSVGGPYIRDLQKNIRNVNKKIANASKTDSLLAEHPDKSLDELVSQKIINTDQKAQIMKKPALQAQVAQYEEQLAQYQKIDELYKSKAIADKAEFKSAVEKAKADVSTELKTSSEQSLKDNLLVLSQFLRLAAHRREEAKDPESDESQAVEGVLLAIYAGEQTAVEAMLKLVNGTKDKVVSVPGEQLQTTYAQVKALAQDNTTPLYTETAPAEGEATPEPVTDPTVANATAAEIEVGDAFALTNGKTEPASNGIANASVADEAANAVAESHWDTTTNNNEVSISQKWVKVPLDAAETETDPNATPAANTNTQSWADDQPEQGNGTPVVPAAAADPNDGYHQVQRNRPRNEGGNHRGRGRGEHRGRGNFRGEGRGRGRGGRGGMASRPRRNEE